MVNSNYFLTITVLAEDLGCVPITHMMLTTPVPVPSSDHLGLLHKHGAHTYIQPHTHIYIKIIFL